jgi:hypothetical protein
MFFPCLLFELLSLLIVYCSILCPNNISFTFLLQLHGIQTSIRLKYKCSTYNNTNYVKYKYLGAPFVVMIDKRVLFFLL